MEEKKKDECCSTSAGSSCCCCGAAKKFLIGILAGVILTAVAFGVCMATKCAVGGKYCPLSSSGQKICPITQMPMPQQIPDQVK